ncbi:MAG TPA: FAD:protein FMN transferase, partial [Balneolaceae bacterium]|nr:FAD:protein FMN transferase [Balneolaceae bacterium]
RSLNMDRKAFLKITAVGGFGTLLGGPALPLRWKEKGVNLTAAKRRSLAMGSVISFTAITEHKKDGYEAIRRAEQVFRSFDKIFSMYDDESEMGLLAKHAGEQFIPLSDAAVKLLNYAKVLYRQSNRFFDVTIEPAMRQWGFRKNPEVAVQPPTDAELRKLEQIIGSEHIILDDNHGLLRKPGMALDTGGIAGGYALDAAIEEMKKCEIAAAFINFSGDIHCFGSPLDGKKWPVFLIDPHSLQPLTEPIYLSNEALSTSGSYQNRRHDGNGHSWGHLLLPRHAEPVEPCGSVTAIHQSAMVADAWSTTAYLGAAPPKEVRTIIL